MAETSLPWADAVGGDDGPYTDDEWSDMFRMLFTRDRTVEGILAGYLNELEVTGAVTPVSVDTGFAIVDGKFYENDAAVNVVIPGPAANPRVDLIVLDKDFAAQTVRIARHAGVEGAGVPATTQTDGVTWELVLAEVTVAVGGAITIVDKRNFASSPLAPPYFEKLLVLTNL